MDFKVLKEASVWFNINQLMHITKLKYLNLINNKI